MKTYKVSFRSGDDLISEYVWAARDEASAVAAAMNKHGEAELSKFKLLTITVVQVDRYRKQI